MEYHESVLARIAQQLSRVMQTTLTAELDRVSASTATQRIQARKQREQQQMGRGALAADMERLKSMPMQDFVQLADTPAGRAVLHESNSRLFPDPKAISVRGLWNGYITQLHNTTPPSLRIRVSSTVVSALFSSDAWNESRLDKSQFPELQVIVNNASRLLHVNQEKEVEEELQIHEFSKQADAATAAFVEEVAGTLKHRNRISNVQDVVRALSVARGNISGGVARLKREDGQARDRRSNEIANTLNEFLTVSLLPAIRRRVNEQIVEEIQTVRKMLLEHDRNKASAGIDELETERIVILEELVDRTKNSEPEGAQVLDVAIPQLVMRLVVDVHFYVGKTYAKKELERLQLENCQFDEPTLEATERLHQVCPKSGWRKSQLKAVAVEHKGLSSPADSAAQTLSSGAALSLLADTIMRSKSDLTDELHYVKRDSVLEFLNGARELAGEREDFRRIISDSLEGEAEAIDEYFQTVYDRIEQETHERWLPALVDNQIAEVNTRVEEVVLAASNSTLKSAANCIDSVGESEAELQEWIVHDRLKATWTRLVVDAAELKATPELFKTLLDKTVPRTFVTLDKWCARGIPALINGTRPK